MKNRNLKVKINLILKYQIIMIYSKIFKNLNKLKVILFNPNKYKVNE